MEPGETPQGIPADKLTLAEITALTLRHGVSAGKMTYDDVNDAYTILGSGNDIWFASDQFHYAHTKLNEDGSIAVRIDSIQPISERCK